MNARQRRLSQYIKRHMKRLEINQTELAKQTGVSRAYVSKLINGKADATPSVNYMEKVASVFGDSRDNALDAAGVYDRTALEAVLDKYPTKASVIRKLIED